MSDERRRRVHRHELDLAASADAVWKALTDAEQVERWFGWHYADLATEIDEMFVQKVERPDEQRLPRAGDGGQFHEFEVESRGGRTRLRLVHSGGLEGSDWDELYDPGSEYVGWTLFLAQLRHYLERHSGVSRRSRHLTARCAEPPQAALDRLERAARDLGGRSVQRTRAVVALRMPGWNDGLLTAAAGPVASGDSSDSTMVWLIVNAWGVDAPRFSALVDELCAALSGLSFKR